MKQARFKIKLGKGMDKMKRVPKTAKGVQDKNKTKHKQAK